MGRCGGFLRKLVRRKVFTDHDLQTTDLRRCLSTLDLIGLGVGATLGSGVYVLTGQVARETAGPSIVLSFLIAGVTSAFAGLCYAEFAARVPRAGSAYVYSYVTVGEFMAFIIGWNLLLEYIIGTASVARAWSAYLDSLIDRRIENFFRLHMPMDVWGLSAYPDFFAFAVTLVVTGLLALGVKESTRFNNVFVVVNLLVICTVVVVGLSKADLANWTLSGSQLPAAGAGSGGFFPFGFSGMMSGAATCFYAYVGFDAIATTGEETKQPQKSIPVSIVLTLLIVGVAYCGVGAVVTLVCPYFLLDARAPLPGIFDRLHLDAVKYVVTIGALFGLSTSLMGAMFPLPRILYAMGSDGLLFRSLGRVSDRFHTPLLGTVVSGLFAGVMATLFDLESLVDMMSIGTLLAYTLVAVCVLLLRYETEENLPRLHSGVLMGVFSAVSVALWNQLAQGAWYALVVLAVPGALALLCVAAIGCQPQNTAQLTFQVPLVPYIPALSCLVNIYLILKLNPMTWLRFAVWMVIGLCIYFFYGICHSNQLSDADSQVSLLASSGGSRGSYTCLIQRQSDHPHPDSRPSSSQEDLEDSAH
ncbi:hypothetical protein ACOMHN_009321 [Nucella lapillus]